MQTQRTIGGENAFRSSLAYTLRTSSCDAKTSAPNATDPTHDFGDRGCFTAPVIARPATNATLTGCLGAENDFDGPNCQNGTWPGSPGAVASEVSTPILFTRLLFRRRHGDGTRGDEFGALENYQQVAFETDLPRNHKRIESSPTLVAIVDPLCREALARAEQGASGPDAVRLLAHLTESGPALAEDVLDELGWERARLRSLREHLEREGIVVSRTLTWQTAQGAERQSSELAS